MQFSDIITFTRSSGGGRFNAQGQYEWLPANEPRIDYDPVTGECLGLLIEESRTNLLTYSSDFANAAWGKANGTWTSSADSRFGTVGVFTETTATGNRITTRNVSLSAGTAYSHTEILKAAGRDRARLQIFSSTGGTVQGDFDLSSGEIVTTFGGTSLIKPLGGGWYACTVTLAATASQIYVVRFYPIVSGSAEYTGDGRVAFMNAGAQLEIGSFPTSHIPTTSAQVTRAADVCVVSNLADWYNPEAGTFVIKHDAPSGRPLLPSGANVIAVSQGPGKLVVAYDAQGSYVSYNDSPYVSGPALSIGAALDLFKSATSYMGARGQSVRYFPRKLEVSEVA